MQLHFSKMKRYFYIPAFIILHAICQGQSVSLTLKGSVTDSAGGAPVSNAGITVTGTGIAAKSDDTGNFCLSITNFPASLSVSHLNYHTKVVNIDSPETVFISVSLKEKITAFPELTVRADKPEIITAGQPLYITDYAFCNDKILVLAYRDKLYQKACLCLMTTDGDTVSSVNIRNSESLFRDCFNNNHLITDNTVWQIFVDSSFINFLYPSDIVKFEEVLKPVIAELNNKFYYSRYYYNNQVLQYFYYEKGVAKFKELKVITSEKNLYMLRDRNRIVAGSGNPEVQARFEDMAFYKPVFAPLVKIRDTVCIFNFAGPDIGFYTDSCTPVKKIPLSLCNNRCLKHELFVDDARGKVYILFRKDGISTLMEINLSTGELENPVTVPGLPYIEKIKVNNGNIYFLHTERNNLTEYKRLYRMKI